MTTSPNEVPEQVEEAEDLEAVEFHSFGESTFKI